MKILELEAENIRGVRKKIPLKPNGENFAIYGPNGSGKSGIVDAIDFLLTGDITRLTGKGTQGITLKQHGKHIDADIKTAVVTAKVTIDGIGQPITLQRRMSKPNELKIEPNIQDPKLDEALEIAKRGQHVLSRSEILKYIAQESNKRAEEIQTVLNIDEVEQLRKVFVKVSNEAERKVQTDESSLKRSIAAIESIIKLERFSEEGLLGEINKNRLVLKGEPVKTIDHESLLKDINPRAPEDTKDIDPGMVERLIDKTIEAIQQHGPIISVKEKKLRDEIKQTQTDTQLKRDLQSHKLLSLGISLIDESGECPLCQKPWPPGKLKELIQERQSRAQKADKIYGSIKTTSTEIGNELTRLNEFIGKIAGTCDKLKEKDLSEKLKEWEKQLKAWSESLKETAETYTPPTDSEDMIKRLMGPADWNETLQAVKEKVSKLKKLTPEQQAWTTLSELKSAIKRYLDDKQAHKTSLKLSEKAKTLEDSYVKAKDNILEKLFDSINADFCKFYRILHCDEEKCFVSELKPEGSKLDLKVDFYGRGAHHPRALHSEGHQDSMGLLLYLALNNKISENKVKLIVLDDVVMSIDAGHRRDICKLFTQHFPDNQFIITTHNNTWARQLNTDGVVKRKNLIHFKGWSIDTGPRYDTDTDVWNKIRKKVNEDDIPSAAHTLREHLEFFLDAVCNDLMAKTTHKSDGRHELGDYGKAAKEAIKNHIATAKRAANSYNNQPKVKELALIETQMSEIINRTQMEQWGINDNVHYNKWSDFGKKDFLPIVDAFQDFENIFRCPQCQGTLSVTTRGETPTALKCPCGSVNHNIEQKK